MVWLLCQPEPEKLCVQEQLDSKRRWATRQAVSAAWSCTWSRVVSDRGDERLDSWAFDLDGR
jgi:hypothetical protein